MFVGNTLHSPVFSLHIKETVFANSDPSNMHTLFFASGDTGNDQIACFESVDDRMYLGRGAWKTVSINTTHLS